MIFPPIPIVIQARMDSQRLPGKVLEPIEGRPMLGHVVHRACYVANMISAANYCQSEGLQQPCIPIVATSDEASDQPIADYCESMGVLCHRGSKTNVYRRFLEASDIISGQWVYALRITADSPLFDVMLCEAVGYMLRSCADLIRPWNIVPCGRQEGLEAFSYHAFSRLAPWQDEAMTREHITPRIYTMAHQLRVVGYDPKHTDGVKLSVDTPAEMDKVRRIYKALWTDKTTIVQQSDALVWLHEQQKEATK